MVKIAVVLLGIASLVAACGPTATATLGPAEECVKSGGVWRSALGLCDRSAGGGGY
jgi:hypothetical protein